MSFTYHYIGINCVLKLPSHSSKIPPDTSFMTQLSVKEVNPRPPLIEI